MGGMERAWFVKLNLALQAESWPFFVCFCDRGALTNSQKSLKMKCAICRHRVSMLSAGWQGQWGDESGHFFTSKCSGDRFARQVNILFCTVGP